MSDHLPQEVLVEIFLRLPIKSIIGCTGVCKSWYSLITSPSFISTHLENQPDYLLVRRCYIEPELVKDAEYRDHTPAKEIYALYYDNDTFDNYLQFADMPLKCVSDTHFRVVGSCNGLLFLSDDMHNYPECYFLWNPSVKMSIKLPKPIFTFENIGPFDHTLGYGFDPVSNDYKVVRMVHSGFYCDRVPPHVELYKLSTGVWQDISHVAPRYKFCERKPGVFLNGACHWVAIKKKGREFQGMVIVLFDIQDETFWEMTLPDSLVKNFCWLKEWFEFFVSKESLCLALHLPGDDKKTDIWWMQEYGDSESWVKQFSISLSHVSFNVGVVDESYSRLHGGRHRQVAFFLRKPLYSRKNGEILWRAESGLLVSYDVAVGKITNLGIRNASVSWYHDALYVNTYKMSLVLLDKRTNCLAGATYEEASNLCKRKPKGGRKVLKGNTKRGLQIVSPLRISGLMYISKMKAKRLSMIERKKQVSG